VIANNEKGVRVTRGGGANMKPQVTVQAPVTSINKVLPEDRFLKRVADTHELIARRAYELFSASGFTHGHDLEDWLGAESEILQPVPFEVTETPDAIMSKEHCPASVRKTSRFMSSRSDSLSAGSNKRSRRRRKEKASVLNSV